MQMGSCETEFLDLKITGKNENPKSIKETWDFKSLLSSILQKSSVHPINHIGQSKTKISQILWAVVFVLGTIGCSYQIFHFLHIYWQYPVLIKEEIRRESQEFPAVTVCNLNRMPNYNEPCLDWIVEDLSVFTERKLHATCRKLKNKNLTDEVLEALRFFGRYTALKAEFRKSISYQSKDTIRSCSYRGETCTINDFTLFANMQYGNCYTFNKRGKDDDPKLISTNVGGRSGLILEVDVQTETYLDITSSVGVRLVVHDPSEDPKPQEDGIDVSLGQEVHLSIKTTSVKRLSAPYRDKCVDYGTPSHNFSDQLECQKRCLQEFSMEECGCADPFLSTTQEMILCDLQNTDQICCLDGVVELMEQNRLPCSCPLPCTTKTYDLSVSSAKWPLVKDDPSSVSFGQEDNINYDELYPLNTENECEPDGTFTPNVSYNDYSVLNNRARILVYFETLDHRIYSQEPMFSETELFSQIGGQLGLWLGICLFACFEYIENIFFLLYFLHIKSKMHKTSN